MTPGNSRRSQKSLAGKPGAKQRGPFSQADRDDDIAESERAQEAPEHIADAYAAAVAELTEVGVQLPIDEALAVGVSPVFAHGALADAMPTGEHHNRRSSDRGRSADHPVEMLDLRMPVDELGGRRRELSGDW